MWNFWVGGSCFSLTKATLTYRFRCVLLSFDSDCFCLYHAADQIHAGECLLRFENQHAHIHPNTHTHTDTLAQRRKSFLLSPLDDFIKPDSQRPQRVSCRLSHRLVQRGTDDGGPPAGSPERSRRVNVGQPV